MHGAGSVLPGERTQRGGFQRPFGLPIECQMLALCGLANLGLHTRSSNGWIAPVATGAITRRLPHDG